MDYSLLTPLELAQYCHRIGFDGQASANLHTLQQLHYLHPQAIAFENLDPWLGYCPRLGESEVFAKLVTDQRGGYCFEHNQLFLRVLRTMGFAVRPLAARVSFPETQLPRTHMSLLVTVTNTDYVADVGFGGLTMTAALQLNHSSAQQTPHELWSVTPVTPSATPLFQLNVALQQEWQNKYSLGLESQSAADYQMANWWVAKHPSSRFVNDLIASRPSATGRHTLLNNRYRFYDLTGAAQEHALGSASELLQLLQEVFAINLSQLPQLPAQLQQRLFTL
jgi:N-hydroxyarylamine O-acetyltransferase